MSAFPRFLMGLAAGLVLAVAVFVWFLYTQLGIPTRTSQWASDITQKKLELARAVQGPKLLLVGGSSTLFGLNAQMIQQQTGVPTINLGTHAGIGFDYLLHEAKLAAKPGDTVLITTEYQLYFAPFGSDPRDDYVLSRAPEFFHGFSLLDKIDMATRVPFKRFQRGWRDIWHPEPVPRSHPPYTDGAKSLDANGDEMENMAADTPPSPDNMFLRVGDLLDGNTDTSRPGFRALSAFIDWARANHITVLATFPPLIDRPEYHQPPTRRAFDAIIGFYRARGVPVISTPEEHLLPFNQFFDTLYHLNHEAALAHTQRLIPELKPYLKPRSS